MILRSIWHGGIVIAFIAALSFSTIFLITVQADGPPPGVDTAKRGDVVEEVFEKEPDEETPDSTLPPGVDTAKRGEVVEEDVEKERDKEATDPTLPPGVDAAQRGDVVKEEGNTFAPRLTAPAPQNLSVDDYDEESVDLSWDSVTNAYGYKLEYRVYGSSSWLHGTFAGSSTSDTIDDLACGTTYYFRVRARGNGGTYSWTYGDPSSSVSQKTSPCVLSPPENLSVDDYDDDSVDLSWDAVTGAVNYKLEYRASGSSTWYHGSFAGSSTSDTLDDLPCTTKYYFRVRARGNGVSYSATYSLPSSSVSRACDAPSPDNLSVTDYDEESVSLSWDAVTDAPYVKVEYKESNSSTWLHGGYVSFGTSYTIDDLECDTTYDFRVRARGDGDPYSSTYGDPSSSVERETSLCVLPAPENLSVDDYDDDSVDLSWDAVTGAAEYQVLYRASGSSTWYHGTYSGSTSDTIDDLPCTTKYYFRVRARGNGVSYSAAYGEPSSSVSRTCTAPPPDDLSVMDHDEESVTLGWDAVTDAPYVRVEYKESSSSTWLYGGFVSFGTSYTMDDLECDTTYDFRVRARGDGDPYSFTYSDPSSIVSQEILCVLPAPENLSVDDYDHESVSLSWDAVTGADAYKVEYRESNTSDWLHGKHVYSGESTTLGDLDCETTYDFRVRVRGNGVSYSLTYSLPSSIESQETSQCRAPPPENVSVTDYDHESVTLGWDEVTDAPYVKVEYRESSTSGWLHGGYVSFGTSYTIGDLECETTYYFRVRARGDGDPYSSAYYGDPSLIVSQETSLCVLPAPENLSVTDYDEESVDLSWDSVTNAYGYKVEYKASNSSTWLHGSFAGSSTSDTIDDLECDTTYDFRVRARGDGVTYSFTYGDPSSIVSQEILCVLPAPENLSVTGYDHESVSLSWDAVTGADAYNLEYRESSTPTWLEGEYIYSGESTTLDDLECETTYYFRVRVRGNGVSYSLTYSLPSSIESQETSQCRAPPPENVRVTDYDHESVTLGWDEVTDASAYKVEYREYGTSSTWLHGTFAGSSTSDTIGDLECETTYYFRVRARGDGDPYSSSYYGDPSSIVERETSLCVLPAPENLSVDDYDDDSVDLSWDAVTGAVEYQVLYRASGSSTWYHGTYSGSTSDTLDDLPCTTKYYFRVRARGNGVSYSITYGEPSSSVSRTCTAPPPDNLSVRDYDEESVTLSWDAVTDAPYVKVEYKESGSPAWQYGGSVSFGTSYTMDDLECDTTYYFRVSARGDGDPYSTLYGDPSDSIAHECIEPFIFKPSPLALGDMSNVWKVPSTVSSSVYVNVEFSESGILDNNVGDIKVNSVDSSGTVIDTLSVDAESDDGVFQDVKGGSLIRIDVDNNAFDSHLALVMLTFHSGSDDSIFEIAKATVQTEARPSAPINGSSLVDGIADTVSLSWKAGPKVVGSNPHHYEVLIPDPSDPTKPPLYTHQNVIVPNVTIMNARDSNLEGTHLAQVRHCNNVGGCSNPLYIKFTLPPIPKVEITVPTGAGGVLEGHNMEFVVTMGNEVTWDVVVSYTIGGTATVGADYVNPGSSVTIPEGYTSANITFAIIDDRMYEPLETVEVTLTRFTSGAAQLGKNKTATRTIADVIEVAAIPDDGATMPFEIKTNQPESTLWLQIDTEQEHAYVFKVEANTGSGWESAKIGDAKTGAGFNVDLPHFGHLVPGEASWVEGGKATEDRHILLDIEPPTTTTKLMNYRITISKPNYTLVKPIWTMPTNSDSGTFGLDVWVRNSSDIDSVDFDDSNPRKIRRDRVVVYCKPEGFPILEGQGMEYEFRLLREGRSSFLEDETQRNLDLGTLCHGLILDPLTDKIERLKIQLWVDEKVVQEATYVPPSPIDWPFNVTDTMWHKQPAIRGDIMGGLQMVHESVCTWSFGVDLDPLGGSLIPTMSTTQHCDFGTRWGQGGRDANNDIIEEPFVHKAVWQHPVPGRQCSVADTGGKPHVILDNCRRADQTYAQVTKPASTAGWEFQNTHLFKPETESLNTIAGIAKPLIEYFKNSGDEFTIVGARPPFPREEVHKVGRTTGWTSGDIIDRGLKEDPECPGSKLGSQDHKFRDFFIECLVWAEYQSRPGDSGSPVFVIENGAENEVLLVGVNTAWLHESGIGGFIPIDRVYAESLREGYDWATEALRPIPVLDHPEDEAITFDGSYLKASFLIPEISPAPNIYFEASLFRIDSSGKVWQVTDRNGMPFTDELTRDYNEVRFNASSIPEKQREGEFTVRVRMCPQDVGVSLNFTYCGSFGAYVNTEPLPSKLKSPTKSLAALRTGDGTVELVWDVVPQATHYGFQYRESTPGDSNDWSAVDGEVAGSPAAISGLRCGAYEFRVSAMVNGAEYTSELGNWSEPVQATVKTCTILDKSEKVSPQGIQVPTVVEIPGGPP